VPPFDEDLRLGVLIWATHPWSGSYLQVEDPDLEGTVRTPQRGELALTSVPAGRFISFVRRLYAGDPGYCATLAFTLQSALSSSTAFFAGCSVRPVAVERSGEIVAECLLIHDPALSAVQVGFFEALPDQQAAVDLLLDEARAEAQRLGVERVVVGMDGHLSVGVGILVEGFARTTFGSNWNKPYYASYFGGLERSDLTVHGGSVAESVGRVRRLARRSPGEVTVREVDLSRWDSELETFRGLCDATLGITDLYAPTNPGHFAELMGDLKAFLRPENLLFAMAGGREVGFVFWHPDFNEVMPTGGALSISRIAWCYFTRRNRIRTVVVNAIGTLLDAPAGTTAALLTQLAAHVDGTFDTYETCFVWDGNAASRGITRYVNATPVRRYAVWTTR
jgi:hypothetical protein